MGCDIHLYVEALRGGKWKHINGPFPCDYCKATGKLDATENQAARPCFLCDGKGEMDRYWWGRNYALFAVLADVRNHHNPDGTLSEYGHEPIHPVRGLPTDCSAYIRKESDEWGCDGHSHSWATVKELLAYPLKRESTRITFMEHAAWVEWKTKGIEPGMTFAGSSGGPSSWYMVESEALDRLRYNIAPRPQEYVACSMTVPYSRSVGKFFDRLSLLAKYGEPDAVRLVYWFDN